MRLVHPSLSVLFFLGGEWRFWLGKGFHYGGTLQALKGVLNPGIERGPFL